MLQPPARTVDNLIALHRASDSFTRLRPATKRGYEQCLELIRRWAVDESTGLAYSADRFRHLFAEIRARAAESTRSFEVDYLLPAAPSTARKRSRSR